MTLFIDPAIGEMRIAEVERKDIAKLHFDLRDKPYQANRTLGVLSKMFSLAEVWGLRPDGSNPCRHVKRYKEHKRERFLSPEETERLGEVLREAESEMPSAVAAFRLLLLTGCRLSEIQFLRYDLRQRRLYRVVRREDARRKLAIWHLDYNAGRPHSALNQDTPTAARRALEPVEGSAPGARTNPLMMRYAEPGLSLRMREPRGSGH